jgi:hypothetical protein
LAQVIKDNTMTMTAEQNRTIAAVWADPNTSMDAKKAMMSQYGVGVTDIMNATGQDLNTVAQAFGGQDWGGLHFDASGRLSGTDWGGPVAQPAQQPAPRMSESQNRSIAAFWEANKNNPKAVMDGMTQFGVGAEDLALAIGRNVNEVGNYLVAGGAKPGFGGFTKGIDATYYGSAASPSQLELAKIEAAKAPDVVVGGTPAGQTAAQGLRDPNMPATGWPAGSAAALPTAPVPGGAGTYYPGQSPIVNSGQPQTIPVTPQGPLTQATNEYQMPMLNALYQSQQQRMTAPAPRFNFQSQQDGPLTTMSGSAPRGFAAGEPNPGALTTAIKG